MREKDGAVGEGQWTYKESIVNVLSNHYIDSNSALDYFVVYRCVYGIHLSPIIRTLQFTAQSSTRDLLTVQQIAILG
jgi:hypothetical protein